MSVIYRSTFHFNHEEFFKILGMNKKGFTPLETIGRRQKAMLSLTGFTLLEILVSTLILALVTTGLAYVFVAGKRHMLHIRSKIQAAELGRLFLAPLQMQVKQNEWASNCLGTGTPANCPNETIGTTQGLDRDYTAHYTVTPNSPIGNLTKVRINITWTED